MGSLEELGGQAGSNVVSFMRGTQGPEAWLRIWAHWQRWGGGGRGAGDARISFSFRKAQSGYREEK